jgi:hypothetical protein
VCHKITPSLLYNLKKISNFENSKIIVHIDKKSNFTSKELIEADNIEYIDERIDIKWGDISQVKCTVNMLRYIENEKYDYVSLLSGEDVFIKSEKEFLIFLLKNTKEFIGIQNIKKEFIDAKERVIYNYPDFFYTSKRSFSLNLLKKIYRLLCIVGFYKTEKKLPYKKIFKGSNWFSLSKKSIVYILEQIQGKKIIDLIEHSFCADEVIFQTILMNSNFKKDIYLINSFEDDNKMSLRYVNWKDGPEYPKMLNHSDISQEFDDAIFFIRKIASNITLRELELTFKYNNGII